MTKSSHAEWRGISAFRPALLATTSAAALLLGSVMAQAGQTVANETTATFSNGAVNVTTSIVIDNTTVMGAVVNAGTITPGINLEGIPVTSPGNGNRVGTSAALTVNNAIIGGGITNRGTISASAGGANNPLPLGILVSNSTVTGGIVNSGTIRINGNFSTFDGTPVANNIGTGIALSTSTIIGGITNSGTIIVNNGVAGIGGFLLPPGPPNFSTVIGSIVNSGKIIVTGNQFAGIFAPFGGVTGGIINSGTITISGSSFVAIIDGIVQSAAATGILVDSGPGPATGPIVNSGTITATGTGLPGFPGGAAGGIELGGIFGLGSAIIAGGVINTGTITASAPNGDAVGIIVFAKSISGGVTNSGTIIANGGLVGIGIEVAEASPGSTIVGGITNTGTIAGNTAAIELKGPDAFGAPASFRGGPTTINQQGGALIGSIIGSGNGFGDVLNFSGGSIVLSGGQLISGLGTYNQTGGTLVFEVTQSTAPGTYPTLSAGSINLTGGTFELAPAAGSLSALAAQRVTVFKNIVVADTPMNGSFASVTTPNTLFSASLSPDPATANALDATLSLSQTGLAASAQDLTQDGRLGLDAPRVLTEAVQDRLVANGGALGQDASAGPKAVAGFSFGNANVWARGADQFGSATAQAASASVGYDINRAAPIIAGIDWRLDNGVVAGVAATYVATSAKFKDGSSTNVNSYQGAVYAGWAGGPWYAAGSLVASFNEFGTARLLTPFGLPGDATSSPSGQSYQGHAEAGYHWVLPAGGVNVSVTPYAALDYVYAQVDGFSETGGFGALQVNSTSTNSFQATLGMRLTSRIAMANAGTLVPELRVGWSHEFLDASQKITASLVGVPGSSFTATGIAFGRDAALIGAGVSLELSPDAKVFVDYDGRLGSHLQEHSVSGGLKMRF
jgi:outer membrane autotransporter protein